MTFAPAEALFWHMVVLYNAARLLREGFVSMTEEQTTTELREIFSPDFTTSKRLLGMLLLVIGIIGFVGILSLDLIGGGREGGIGPTQRAALALMIAIAIFGLSLLPLGKQPA